MASTTSPARPSRLAKLAVVGTILRRLRTELGLALIMLAVVAFTSFALVAAPQLVNRMSDDALQQSVSDAAAINRNISVEQGLRLPAGDSGAVFQPVMQRGAEFQNNLPASVQAIMSDSQYVVDSSQFEMLALPDQPIVGFPRFLRFRYQEGIEDQIELFEGRMPAPADPVQITLDAATGEQTIPVFETAITPKTADEMQIGLGDQVLLKPDGDDPLNRSAALSELQYNVIVNVVGIIQPIDPEAAYWFEDTRLQEPFILETPDVVMKYAMGLMSPDAYAQFLSVTPTQLWDYNWRYFVNPGAINAGEIDKINDNLRNVEVTYGASGFSPVDEPSVRTGLTRIIDRYRGQRQLTVSILSLAVIGLLVVALAVIGLLATLIAARRQRLVTLIRSRGASVRQLTTSQIVEGALLAVPAALVGYILAVLFVPGRIDNLALLALGIVALASASLLVLAALPVIRRDLGTLLSSQDDIERTSTRRIVLELAIAGFAIAGIVLFRRRGLDTGSLSNPDSGFDPFLATVPVLLGLAVGILTLRLYTFPIRFFAWLGSLRRSLTMFVGFRRIARQPLASRLPIIVILLAVAIAVFSSIFQFSISEGQQNSTWHEVGAPYRIESLRENAPVSTLIDLSGLNQIEATANALLIPRTRLVTNPPGFSTLNYLAVETDAYETVNQGNRADPHFPEIMLQEQNIREIGTPANPIPAIVSSTWVDGSAPSNGDVLTLEIERVEVTFIVRAVRERFPGMSQNEPFLVSSLDSLRNANPDQAFRPTWRYLRAPDSASADIRSALREQTLGARLISRGDLYQDLAKAPLVAGVSTGFRLVVVMAGAFAALAAIAALALTSSARARDLGYLRTLGLSSEQAIWLTVIEQLPPVTIAALVGAALGIGLVRLIEPGVDLTVFTGTSLPAEILIDWFAIGLVVLILLGVVGLTIGIFSYLTRRTNLGNVLRLGDE